LYLTFYAYLDNSQGIGIGNDLKLVEGLTLIMALWRRNTFFQSHIRNCAIKAIADVITVGCAEERQHINRGHRTQNRPDMVI
jgi:hypothetical protein